MDDELIQLMATPLPSIRKQIRKLYRPTIEEVIHVYDLLNKCVFDNKLTRPEIILKRQYKVFGWCIGSWEQLPSGSHCTIKLMDKWYCIQWMITILAHEMAHQYTWDIERPDREAVGKKGLMSHGTSFLQHRAKMAEFNIRLKHCLYINRWFKYQRFDKC